MRTSNVDRPVAILVSASPHMMHAVKSGNGEGRKRGSNVRGIYTNELTSASGNAAVIGILHMLYRDNTKANASEAAHNRMSSERCEVFHAITRRHEEGTGQYVCPTLEWASTNTKANTLEAVHDRPNRCSDRIASPTAICSNNRDASWTMPQHAMDGNHLSMEGQRDPYYLHNNASSPQRSMQQGYRRTDRWGDRVSIADPKSVVKYCEIFRAIDLQHEKGTGQFVCPALEWAFIKCHGGRISVIRYITDAQHRKSDVSAERVCEDHRDGITKQTSERLSRRRDEGMTVITGAINRRVGEEGKCAITGMISAFIPRHLVSSIGSNFEPDDPDVDSHASYWIYVHTASGPMRKRWIIFRSKGSATFNKGRGCLPSGTGISVHQPALKRYAKRAHSVALHRRIVFTQLILKIGTTV